MTIKLTNTTSNLHFVPSMLMWQQTPHFFGHGAPIGVLTTVQIHFSVPTERSSELSWFGFVKCWTEIVCSLLNVMRPKATRDDLRRFEGFAKRNVVRGGGGGGGDVAVLVVFVRLRSTATGLFVGIPIGHQLQLHRDEMIFQCFCFTDVLVHHVLSNHLPFFIFGSPTVVKTCHVFRVQLLQFDVVFPL